MTTEPEETSADAEEAEYEFELPGSIFVDDLQAVIFDPPRTIGGHEVFAAMACAGDVLLGLTSTMKMHKLELVKGMPSTESAKVRSIRKTPPSTGP